MNIWRDNLLMRFFYIQNREMCLSKTILYQYFAVFVAPGGTASPLKAFYMSLHSTKNRKYKENVKKENKEDINHP